MSDNGKKNTWFSFLYHTRLRVNRGETPILNLSLLFTLIALLSAPHVVVLGLIACLALGYQINIEKNAKEFPGSLNSVIDTAAKNIRSAVDSVIKDGDSEEE